MTSPPAEHDPRDNRPGREDADDHPSLGEVEAGPQRHISAEEEAAQRALFCLFIAVSPDIADDVGTKVRAWVKSVDRAAREECARIADDFAFGRNAAAAIRQSIKD